MVGIVVVLLSSTYDMVGIVVVLRKNAVLRKNNFLLLWNFLEIFIKGL